MLVLTRKAGEQIVIGGRITVTVNRVAGNRVTLGIDAPQDVRIVRGELAPIVESFDEPAEPQPPETPPAPLPLPINNLHNSPLNSYLPRSAR